MTRRKLTLSQLRALEMVARRTWPAGEPRRAWLGLSTARVLDRLGLIEDVPGTTASDLSKRKSPVIVLTKVGEDALGASNRESGADRSAR